MNIKNKNILVIGGAGFIGSHFIELLLKNESCNVVIFDNFVRGKYSNLKEVINNKRLKIYEKGADICKFEILCDAIKDNKIDYVVHFAALWLLHCQEFPRTAFDVNVSGTFNVLEACRLNKIKKLVFSSSASVYGDNKFEKITEHHPQESKNLYGATKIACESLIRSYFYRYNLNTISLRYMNVYGTRQDYRGAYIAVMMKMLDCIEKNEPITIYGDGNEYYDFVSVLDCARANYLALKTKKKFGYYNIGSGMKTSLRELAELLIKLKKKKVRILYKKDTNKTLVKQRVSDISLAKTELNYIPKVKLDNGLVDLIKWRNFEKDIT